MADSFKFMRVFNIIFLYFFISLIFFRIWSVKISNENKNYSNNKYFAFSSEGFVLIFFGIMQELSTGNDFDFFI